MFLSFQTILQAISILHARYSEPQAPNDQFVRQYLDISVANQIFIRHCIWHQSQHDLDRFQSIMFIVAIVLKSIQTLGVSVRPRAETNSWPYRLRDFAWMFTLLNIKLSNRIYLFHLAISYPRLTFIFHFREVLDPLFLSMAFTFIQLSPEGRCTRKG